MQPASAATSGFACQAPNGLSSRYVNDPAALLDGRLSVPGFRTATIGGPNVNWAYDPYKSASWGVQFHSLRWLEGLTDAYRRTGERRYLDRALAVSRDWVTDNPRTGTASAYAWNKMYSGLRASALACVAREAGTVPSWLTSTLHDHAAFLSDSRNYAGYWNQGLEQNIGLLAIGCQLGSVKYQQIADDRMRTALPRNIDGQGALNEQAPGYGDYLYRRWRQAGEDLRRCGRDAGEIVSRTDALALFLARATLPDGSLVQLGDTYATSGAPAGDAYGEYVASRGALGTAPAGRVAVYAGGFAFVRGGWGTDRPYEQEVAYSLRFGPAFAYHGHLDHTAYTLYAGGRQWLVDAGHYGYTAGAYRDWLRSPEAHNLLSISGSQTGIDRAAATPTPARISGTTASAAPYESWTFTNRMYRQRVDREWRYLTRVRRLAVERTSGVTAVVDQMSGSVLGPVRARQLWHLPSDVSVTTGGRDRATATDGRGRQLVVLRVPLGEALERGDLEVWKGSSTPIQGWVSKTSGSKVAAPTVGMSRLGRSARIATVLVPGRAGETVTASASRSGDTWTITVRAGSGSYTVTVPPTGALTLR
jgi:hypothetical protein